MKKSYKKKTFYALIKEYETLDGLPCMTIEHNFETTIRAYSENEAFQMFWAYYPHRIVWVKDYQKWLKYKKLKRQKHANKKEKP